MRYPVGRVSPPGVRYFIYNNLNPFHANIAAANSKPMNEPSAFCQSSILHFGILSILLILSPFPAGFAIEVLDMINRIYRIKSFGNSLGRKSIKSQALLTNCLGLPLSPFKPYRIHRSAREAGGIVSPIATGRHSKVL